MVIANALPYTNWKGAILQSRNHDYFPGLNLFISVSQGTCGTKLGLVKNCGGNEDFPLEMLLYRI